MSRTDDLKYLHDLATELNSSDNLDAAMLELADAIVEDFALAIAISDDDLSRLRRDVYLSRVRTAPEVTSPQ